MTASGSVHSLAHASIPAPRNKVHLGIRRLEVYLRPAGDGRFRWFLGDGTPTVVEGESVVQAMHVAQMAWPDMQVVAAPAMS